MIQLNFTQSDLDELNYWRFHHPDPVVMKRCETVWLRAGGMKTGEIQKLTGWNVKTIQAHLNLYKNGGIEGLKHREPRRPKSDLEEHKTSIEEEFRLRPPSSIKEAAERIFQLTGIRRSKTRVEVFLKKIGMKFFKTGGIPARADLDDQEEFLKKS